MNQLPPLDKDKHPTFPENKHERSENCGYDIELSENEELDDILPLLDAPDCARVMQVEKAFWNDFDNVQGRLEGLDLLARTIYGGDKKRVALEMVPNLINKGDGAFIFKMLDGKSVRDMLIEQVRKCVGNTNRYDEMVEWMKQ